MLSMLINNSDEIRKIQEKHSKTSFEKILEKFYEKSGKFLKRSKKFQKLCENEI